jgi:chlorobactene glucosyltransferase
VKRAFSAAFHVLVLAALTNALVLLLRNLRYLRRLEDEAPPSPDNQPDIEVLIPARNEAEPLPRCLDSLLSQTYPAFSVTILDDQSTDSTPRIAERYAANDERVRWIRGEPLPPGWTGKPWACQQLADQANGELLLFVDADTWFTPDVLDRTAGIMQREQPGLFSVMPHQEAETFVERLVLPGLYMLFLCGTPLWKLENSRFPDIAAANGQFICIPAEVYRRLGGHGLVRDQVVEDIALSRQIKMHGHRILARTAISSVHCRMYRSSWAVLDGFSKNAYASFGDRPDRAVGAIAVMLATHVVPAVLLIMSLRRSSFRSAALPAVELALGMLLRLIVSWRMGFRAREAILAQLNAVAFVVITLRSMWWRYVRGGYRWKGRSYQSAGTPQ